MNKAEFIGYLTALQDMVDTDREYDLIAKIINRAKTLEESVVSYPYWPTYPNIWCSTANPYNSGFDIPEEFTYNDIKIKKDLLVGPNDWEVKCDNPPNFTVVK